MSGKDIYDLFDDFLNSSFIEEIIILRLSESIGMVRSTIDNLEYMNRVGGGLHPKTKQDLDDNWMDLEALTRAYVYFSGDEELDYLPEWRMYAEDSVGDVPDDWAYWTPGSAR